MEGMNIESIKKELEDIWTSNVKNDVFADNPLDYACSLSGFLKEYVPDHIEAGKYSDANENVTDVYLKTEVWFSDEFGCDEIGFVAKACLGYWRETARACTQPFKMQLMESLREQSLNEGEFRDYTLDLRKIIAEEFKDEECCRRRLEWADEDIAAATKDR